MPRRNNEYTGISYWMAVSVLYLLDFMLGVCTIIGRAILNIYKKWTGNAAELSFFLICIALIYAVVTVLLPSPPVSSASYQHVRFDIQEWLQENNLQDIFKETGIQTKRDLFAADLNSLPKYEKLLPEKKKKLVDAIHSLKEETWLELWMDSQGLSHSAIQRLKSYGIGSLESLSTLKEDMIQTITQGDITLTDYNNLKIAVKFAAEAAVNKQDLESQLMYGNILSKINKQQTSFWWTVLKIVLTLLIGGVFAFLTFFVMVMDCIRNRFYRPQLSVAVSPQPTAGLQVHDKSWLWKWFWGASVSPQYCMVKWGWQEPQVVGSTMTFTVKLFRKNGQPFIAQSANAITVEILHKGTKVACTKHLETEQGESNTIRVSFTVHKAGTYKIAIMVSGKQIKDSPFSREFEPGPIDASLTGFTNYCSTIVCTAGSPYPLTIETQDSFGNPAVYKADQNSYFKIKVVETESNAKYVPATQLINMPDKKQLIMHITMAREGCYQASVSYGDIKLRNGDFNILVINNEDMACVNKNMARKSHNIWYEARLLQGNANTDEKAKKVYVYISPKQLTLKEYYLKIIGKKLYTWRVCPSTKFYFSGHNSRYDLPVMTIYDCCQPPVVLATKDRSIIAATFTNFLLRNIGGSETFQDKQAFFVQEIRKLQRKGNLTIKIDRSNLLNSSYRATRNFDTSDWYKSIHIQFQGEQGLDWGGLRREWFEIVCTELFDPSHSGLFCRFTEDSQGLVHPNPRRKQELKPKFYEFAGKVVGKCLFDSALGSAYRQLVKGRFSRSFLAQLIGLQVNYKYFETDDPVLYKSKIRYIEENNIEDMELTFSEEEYNEGQLLRVVDLVPNGSNKPVDNQNKQHYLNCLAQYKLAGCVREEVEYFLKGLNTLIPDTLLSIFDENELELLMCGTDNYSITDLKAHAVIEGSSYHFIKVLDWFWTVIASFTEEQMARLLQFTTGCSQLPAGGFAELNPKFQISFSPSYNTLPTAHTCFNQLCLPDYDTIDKFHKSLLIAINEGAQGFGLV